MDQQPLVCPSHKTQYIGVLIIGILVGGGASFAYFKKASAPAGGENTYQAGFDAAKKRVLESPTGMMFRTPDDVRAVSGTVTAINGDRITLHTQSTNPFDDPSLADRTVLVTSDTKIIKISQADPKIFQAQMEAFMKTIQSGKRTGSTPPPTPPQPTRTTVDAKSVIVGSTLTVTAGANIKTSKEFTASEVQVLNASVATSGALTHPDLPPTATPLTLDSTALAK